MYIYPTPLLSKAGCNTKSNFKWSTASLNLEFFLPLNQLPNQGIYPSLILNLSMKNSLYLVEQNKTKQKKTTIIMKQFLIKNKSYELKK